MNTDPPQPEQPPRFIARQLALGFGAVSIVAVAMCMILLGIIGDVGDLVSGMRHGEQSIRQGLELATAVREQSVHIAHSLIDADDSRLERYAQSRQHTRTRIQHLAAVVPVAERWRLKALGDKTQRIHELFMSSALPAARRGDVAEVRRVHHAIEQLGHEASEHADALALSVESEMAHSHVLATDSTRLGLLVGGAGILLVLVLSVGFTLRLRGAVLQPLLVLTEAARRFGRGEFDTRVGAVGRGELSALGSAFDRMTEELEVRQQRLVQSERMAAIGQLAAGVAHELNNPIGIIRGYLKTMSPGQDTATLREELSILDEEAAQCQRIAEDLLQYARADELSFERLEVGPFLGEIVKRFREGTSAHGRPLAVDVQDAQVALDPARMRQVVRNLLLNADQAAPDGTEIVLRGSSDGDDYVIEVQDGGGGVDVADRQRIFEPFFSRRRGGSGLGLSVVLGIVEAHRGTIEVRDAEGPGAVFRLRLPRAQAPAIAQGESS